MLIKPTPVFPILAGLFAAAVLVACANPGGDLDHDQHHTDQATNTEAPGPSGESQSVGMMGRGVTHGEAGCGMMGCGTATASGNGQHMDKDAMCAMYRSMQNAPTDQERQAMMDRQMPDMSPEMRQQHMEMMRQQCQ